MKTSFEKNWDFDAFLSQMKHDMKVGLNDGDNVNDFYEGLVSFVKTENYYDEEYSSAHSTRWTFGKREIQMMSQSTLSLEVMKALFPEYIHNEIKSIMSRIYETAYGFQEDKMFIRSFFIDVDGKDVTFSYQEADADDIVFRTITYRVTRDECCITDFGANNPNMMTQYKNIDALFENYEYWMAYKQHLLVCFGVLFGSYRHKITKDETIKHNVDGSPYKRHELILDILEDAENAGCFYTIKDEMEILKKFCQQVA